MQKGLIISNISNLYEVKVEDKIIECKPMGKIKQNRAYASSWRLCRNSRNRKRAR